MKRWTLYRGSMRERPEGKYILYMDYIEERMLRSDLLAAEALEAAIVKALTDAVLEEKP